MQQRKTAPPTVFAEIKDPAMRQILLDLYNRIYTTAGLDELIENKVLAMQSDGIIS